MKVTEINDAFRPSLNPVHYELKQPETIRSILIKQGAITKDGKREKIFVVAVNGDYKLESDWDSIVYPNDLLVTVALPPHMEGGGGSNPLRLVAMVAVMVASIYFPPLAGLGAFGTAMLQGAIMIGGSLLVNSLLPAPKVGGGGINDSGQAKQANFIGAQANQVRGGAPVANLYGRRRIYPDLIMQPYFEMSGNEVYMYSLYVVTQGKIDIEEIFIEKTPINNFDEVEYKVIEPFQEMDMFPDNVYTAPEVADIKLDTPSDTGELQTIGYKESITYKAINDSWNRPPNSSNWNPTYEKTTSYSPINSSVNFRGGYISTPLTVETDLIGIDVFLPRGLAYMNDQGNPVQMGVNFIAQARLIDDNNNPSGSWFNLTKWASDIPEGKTEIVHSIPTPSWRPNKNQGEHYTAGIWIRAATINPIMQTYTFNVPRGRYEVRVGRTNAESASSRSMDEIRWIGLRSFMPNKKFYGNVTLLAVKMRSSNNLNNNVARRLNVLGTRIIPVFNGKEWVEQPTRSIAWAAADVLRNKEYGRGLKDSRINIQELMRLDRVWYGRGDFFDGYFTEQMTIWEALSRILEVGRTKPVHVAGVIDFIRNEPKIAPSQMFTPENIVKDSFNTQYIFPKTGEADHVIVEYTDPVSWLPVDMVCALPDSKMLKSIRLAMHGITSPQQAWREGIHRAAMHREQREFSSWSTELEGLAVSYGNEVLLSYDEPEWGLTGRIEYFEGDIIYTNNTLDFTGNNLIALRAKNGSIMGTYKIEKVGEKAGRLIDIPLNKNGEPDLSDGSFREPTHYIFGNTNRVGKKVVITSIIPSGDNQVGLSGVLYSSFAHDAEKELEMPVVVPPHDPVEEVLAITWIRVQKTIERNIFSVSCNQARGAKDYEFQISDNIGSDFKPLQISETPLYTGALPYGNNVRIRARAIGTHNGSWFYWEGQVDKETSGIESLTPDLKVLSKGEFVVNFDITITAVTADEALNYYILQDGLIIWSGILLSNQSATLSRQIVKEVESEEDVLQVEFKTYGVDSQNVRTIENSIIIEY